MGKYSGVDVVSCCHFVRSIARCIKVVDNQNSTLIETNDASLGQGMGQGNSKMSYLSSERIITEF